MQNISKDDFAHIDVHVSARMRILSSPDELPIFNGYVGENKQVTDLLGKSKLPEELLLFFRVHEYSLGTYCFYFGAKRPERQFSHCH
jgi:hypothetical protein